MEAAVCNYLGSRPQIVALEPNSLEDVREDFRRTGTTHHLAISGLHVMLLTTVLVLLLQSFHLPKPVCAALLIPVLWCYAALTGWQASAVRSVVMGSVLLTALQAAIPTLAVGN